MNNSLLTEIRTRINRLDNTELNQLVQMVNDRRDGLTLQARGDLWVGKPVSFDDRGYRHFGRVVKVNRKNSKVKALREDKMENGSRPTEWTVPNSMLSHAPTFNVDQMKHTSVPVG
jgi:hypothetical protein